MAETKRQPRESISTRIDADAHAVLEDGAKELGRHYARRGASIATRTETTRKALFE
jgi:hypothetical protein